MQLALRRQLAARLGRAPIGWFSRRRTGELAKVVGEDVSAVHPFIAHAPGELVAAFVVPLVSLVYLFTVDWRLTLITLIPVALAVALVPLMMTARPAARAGGVRRGHGPDRALRGGVRAGHRGGQGVRRVGERAHRAFLYGRGRLRRASSSAGCAACPVIAAGMQLALSPPFVLLVVLTGGAARITSGGLAPADLLPFLLLGLGLTAPVAALGHGFDDLQAAGRAVGRIRDVLAVRPLPRARRSPRPASRGGRPGGAARAVRVRLRDDAGPGARCCAGVDLVLEPGTVTALVGPSGSGKSTLVQLLPRFFDPTHGSVLLGGVDLREIDERELYRLVSFVFQDVRLLRASVADNIALAVPHADRDDVVRAARLAGIHDRDPSAAARLRHGDRRGGRAVAAARHSGSRSPARCSPTRPCWCSTRRPPSPTRTPSRRCAEALATLRATARSWSSPTAWRRSPTPTPS